jgi:hypothetical protein
VFVDELELPSRTEAEHAGWPDYGVIWDDRVWIIELKTEAVSHRPGQLSHYADLAKNYYPGKQIDITYLTPPIHKDLDQMEPGVGCAQLTWDEVMPLVSATWRDGGAWQRSAVAALSEVLSRSGTSWTNARPRHLSVNHATDQGLELAAATADDGTQRAVDVSVTDPEDLDESRLKINDALRSAANGSPLRRVQPWIWNTQTSGGQALTSAGAETGYELRLSRYAEPR